MTPNRPDDESADRLRAEKVARAVDAIVELRERYRRELTTELNDLIGSLPPSSDGSVDAAPLVKLARDMDAHGASYGFPLLSILGRSLYRLVWDRECLAADEADAVDAHLNGMAAVVENGIMDPDSTAARQLLARLGLEDLAG